MIKNFESFFMSSRDDEPSFEDQLNSSIESKYPEIWSGHKEFFKKLNNLFSELPGSSYSNFAKADRRRGIDYRSEMVSKDIEDYMRDCRITWEEILGNKELIKKCIDVYSYISGYVDIILWRLAMYGRKTSEKQKNSVSKVKNIRKVGLNLPNPELMLLEKQHF